MIRNGLLFLALTMAMATMAFAQGSGSMADPGSNDSAFRVSKTVTARAIDGTSNSKIVLQHNNAKMTLNITEDTKFEAERGADVKNPSQPVAADLKSGQDLRVVYDPDSNLAVEVRILKRKS